MTGEMGRHVCVLRPSQHLGGGIEVYVDAVVACLEREGVAVEQCTLRSPQHPSSLRRRAAFVIEAIQAVRRLRGSTGNQILVFHPNFTTLGVVLRFLAREPKPALRVICYGADVWAARPSNRRAWKRPEVELVAVSSFTAGALAPLPVRLLAPGIPCSQYDRLTAGTAPGYREGDVFRVLSVFRLGDADLKGARTIIEAVEEMMPEHLSVQITFAGVGPAPVWLVEAADRRREWIKIVPSPSAEELVALYAESNVVILATQLSPDSGEGFGIVLAEAQLAGCLVIAPACDGSADAILPGITGLRPVDSSPTSLRDVLLWCLRERQAAARVAANGRVWASTRFRPERYHEEVMAVLWGSFASPDLEVILSSDSVDHGTSANSASDQRTGNTARSV